MDDLSAFLFQFGGEAALWLAAMAIVFGIPIAALWLIAKVFGDAVGEWLLRAVVAVVLVAAVGVIGMAVSNWLGMWP